MRAFAIIVFLCTLLASYLAYRYAEHTIKNKKPEFPVVLVHLCICLIAAFCVRFLQSKTPNDTFGIALLKSCASLPTVLQGHHILSFSLSHSDFFYIFLCEYILYIYIFLWEYNA